MQATSDVAMETQSAQQSAQVQPGTQPEIEPTPPLEPPNILPFFQRWRRTNNEYANTWFASSQALLRRAPWVSPTTREGRIITKFEYDWRSSLCPVETWYQTQVRFSQESGSTTRFTSIQHRRNRDSPYFHEFLLIRLADAEGSYYRLERTGGGSNVRAITLLGCMACDMIEWFPASRYQEFILNKPSDLIAEVQFPSEFDILDILAVCYSIQQRRSRKYMLQSYNCYFFCCTILSILARRSFPLEGFSAPDRLSGILEQAFARISVLSNAPLTPEAKKYSILRVCAALDPESPSPGQTVVNRLRTIRWEPINAGPVTSGEQEQGQSGLNQYYSPPFPPTHLHIEPMAPKALEDALAETLWLNDINRLVRTNFRPIMDQGAWSLCHALLNPDSAMTGPRKTKSYKFAEKVYTSEYANYSLKRFDHDQETWFQLSHGNRKAATGTRVVDGLLRWPLSVVSGLIGGLAEHRLHGSDKWKYTLKIIKLKSRRGFLGLSGAYAGSDYAYELQKNVDLMSREHENEFINRVFDKCESCGLDFANELPARIVQLMRHTQFLGDWSGLVFAIQALLHDSLEIAIKSEVVSSGDRITLVRTGNSNVDQTSEQVSLLNFQQYIREHIQTYATRVEQNRLDQANLVYFDVEVAISNVWRSMPKGFGARDATRRTV